MRIDKYLWCVRIYKTRAQAKEACLGGKVWVDGDQAKPARVIGEGDELKVRKKAIEYAYEIQGIPKSRVGPALVAQYLDDITPKEELDKLELMKLQYKEVFYQKLVGRPTKKQRRDLDQYRK